MEITSSKKANELTSGPPFVKSAGRVLLILEYFDRVQRPANLVEICRNLSFPVSSTSHLLWSMVKLGFLRFNPNGRTFVPTCRVSLLGTWTESRLFRGGKIYDLVEEMEHETGCVIILSARDCITSKCIFSTDKNGLRSVRAIVGDVRGLHETAAGVALLSALPPTEAGKIVRRLQSEIGDGSELFDANAVLAKISEACDQGYFIDDQLEDSDSCEISMTVNLGEGLTHAISCYGQRDDLIHDVDYIVYKMRTLISKYLGQPVSEVHSAALAARPMTKDSQIMAATASAAFGN